MMVICCTFFLGKIREENIVFTVISGWGQRIVFVCSILVGCLFYDFGTVWLVN